MTHHHPVQRVDTATIYLCCVWGIESIVELLEAEYQLFKSAVYSGVAMVTGPQSANERRRRLLEQFVAVQERHATVIRNLLTSHQQLAQVRYSFINPLTPYTGDSIGKRRSYRLLT